MCFRPRLVSFIVFSNPAGATNIISCLNSFIPIYRDELLDQIRTGVTLKKVSADEQRQQPLPAEAGGGAGGGIAGMLQRALQERSGALRFSSSEDEGSETTADDDDEWD